MNESPHDSDDEISLLDIYNFIREGWKTIVGAALASGAVGTGAALYLPEKYEATALIDPAFVAGSPVEPILVLSEKLRSATYFQNQTLTDCGLSESRDGGSDLAKSLNAAVKKQSSYVSVSFKAVSPEAAKLCLESVLRDVQFNQSLVAQPLIWNLASDMASIQKQLEVAQQRQDQGLRKDKDQLELAKQKLNAATELVASLEKGSLRSGFNDNQFPVSALLLSALASKKTEIKELESEIKALELKIKTALPEEDIEVLRLEGRKNNLQSLLKEPSTRTASFATPIHAPESIVEPKRMLIVTVSILIGGFFGLLLGLLRRTLRTLREQSQQPLT